MIKSDWTDYHERKRVFEEQKAEFDEWAVKIQETSLRLNDERDKVLHEKSEYDFER